MPNVDNETLLSKWLEGQLNDIERREFEQRCIDDAAFSMQVETANTVVFESQQLPEFTPPEWDRESTIAFSRKPTHFNWQWLSVGSFAMSFLAMFIVVSGFQIHTEDGNLHMGFNLTPTSTDVAKLLDDKIKDYQANNQTLMAQYVDALQTQQAQSRTELTRFLIETSREERREDFAELIKFINEQRDDDQRFYARQLNKLEAEIYSAPYQE